LTLPLTDIRPISSIAATPKSFISKDRQVVQLVSARNLPIHEVLGSENGVESTRDSASLEFSRDEARFSPRGKTERLDAASRLLLLNTRHEQPKIRNLRCSGCCSDVFSQTAENRPSSHANVHASRA
jgi:hypothetical protein